MLSGNLKYQIDLYKRSGTDNNIDYVFYKSVYSQILFKSGSSVVESYQLLNTKTLTVKIRNRKDIDETMRVKIKDNWYDIIHLQTIGGFAGDIIIDLALTI